MSGEGGCLAGRPWRRHRARHPGQEGAVAVEFALIAILFFILVFGMVDFGFAMHAWHVTSNGAREGARKAAVSSDLGQIERRVRSATSPLDQQRLIVTVSCSKGGGGFKPCTGTWTEDDLVRVEVTYHYNLLTPATSLLGLGRSIDVRSVAEARFEGD